MKIPDDLLTNNDLAGVVLTWARHETVRAATEEGCDCATRPRRCPDHDRYEDGWIEGAWDVLQRLGIVDDEVEVAP